MSFNYLGPLLRANMVALDGRFFNVLGIFVIGLWTGRQILFHDLHENKTFLIRVAAAGIVIGIPANIFLAMESPAGLDDAWFLLVQDTLMTYRYLLLTAGYVAVLMLLFLTRFQKLLMNAFSAVGKTALSNYIIQSIIGIFLFYDVGLGLGKYFGSALLTLAVIVVFVIQIVISTLWLKRYKFGPLEWMWRVLTYGRYMKNRLPNK